MHISNKEACQKAPKARDLKSNVTLQPLAYHYRQQMALREATSSTEKELKQSCERA
jgi:hypothetical protein